MAYKCSFLAERRLAVVQFQDEVDGQDLEGMVAALYGHPHWESGYDVLWDGTRISRLVVAPGDVESLLTAFMRVTQGEGARRAAFVLSQDDHFTLARLLIARRRRLKGGEGDYRVFRTENEAMSWLGHQSASLAPPAAY